tara:strand:+ start:132 stop:917 length:786 start_codon:yes stop_codon:yes gene_type:complete
MVTNDGDVVDLDQEIAQVLEEQGMDGDNIKVIRDFVYIRDRHTIYHPYKKVLYHVGTKQIYNIDRVEVGDIYDIRDHRMLYVRHLTAFVEDMKTGTIIDKTEIGYDEMYGDVSYVKYMKYYSTLYGMNCPRKDCRKDPRRYYWNRHRACPWRDPSVYKKLGVYEDISHQGDLGRFEQGTLGKFKKILEIVRHNSDHHLLPYILHIYDNSRFRYTRFPMYNKSPNDEFIAFKIEDGSTEVIRLGLEENEEEDLQTTQKGMLN